MLKNWQSDKDKFKMHFYDDGLPPEKASYYCPQAHLEECNIKSKENL